MKIAIIEKGHFEVAYSLILLFDRKDNQLTIFIDKQSYEQLTYLLGEKTKSYKWIIQEKESNREFIKSIFKHIRNTGFDLLYFNTIADNFIHYAWGIQKIKPEKVVMSMHDIKGFFHYSPSFSIRKAIRFIGKRSLIKAIPSFNVLSETLIPLLRQELRNTKTIFNVPGALFEPVNFIKKEFKENEPIKIAIPGSVDIRRRDYDSVLHLLEKVKETEVAVSVTIAGAFRKKHSEMIYTKCIQYIQSNNNLHVYETEIVSQEEFDRVMNEAHFIWMPLNSFAIVTDGTKEQYGVSISTGNVGDVIRHARPFFAPVHFSADPALQKSCYHYNDVSDIIDTLKKIDSSMYETMQNEAFNSSMNYTKDKIIERNKSLFE